MNRKHRYRRRMKASRTKIPNGVGIEECPKVVSDRTRYGDWEADLIEDTKGSGFILSLYERKSRFGQLIKLETKSSEEIACALIGKLKGYKVKTVTYDNGLEFSGHCKVTQVLGAQGYFCQHYHSWGKGGVENFNGLVRQYLPKDASFADLTDERLKEIEEEINHRPRKVLNIKSPSFSILTFSIDRLTDTLNTKACYSYYRPMG